MTDDLTETMNSNITHAEFIGPPGSGKSTLYRKLTADSRVIGEHDPIAIRRTLLANWGSKYRLLYRLVPPFVREHLERAFIFYRLGHPGLEEFIRDHPEFVAVIARAMDCAAHEPERIFSLSRMTAERYQISTSAAHPDEIACLDEGFAQKAAGILWRMGEREFPIEDYLDCVPSPDLLIFIDAPADVCIERQQERGDINLDKPWTGDDLEKAHNEYYEHFEAVVEHVDSPVVRIKNVGDPDDAVERIQTELFDQ